MADGYIDSAEMAQFFFTKLVNEGYAPTREEAIDIADIAFDYMLEMNMIEEEDDL